MEVKCYLISNPSIDDMLLQYSDITQYPSTSINSLYHFISSNINIFSEEELTLFKELLNIKGIFSLSTDIRSINIPDNDHMLMVYEMLKAKKYR